MTPQARRAELAELAELADPGVSEDLAAPAEGAVPVLVVWAARAEPELAAPGVSL